MSIMADEYLSDKNFCYAVKVVFEHEGLFSDRKDDPGGPTKYGVSLMFLRSLGELNDDGIMEGDIDEDGDIDIDDIKSLTPEKTCEIFYNHFWLPNKYNFIAQMSESVIWRKFSTKALDFCVNMGQTRANILLQRAMRAADKSIILKYDGIIGSKSLEAINKISNYDTCLLGAFRSEAACYYRSLNRPSDINGWLNRAYW